MSARNFTILHPGGGAIIPLPRGRYFYVRTATSNIDVTTHGNPGSPITLTGIPAGSKFGPVAEGQDWTELRVASSAAQTIEITISDDGNFEIAASVTVAGVAAVAEQPSGTLADTADTSQAAASQTTISANLSRRRITIGHLSTSASASVRVSQAGGDGRGIELGPGVFQEFKTTAQLIVRNVTGAAGVATWYALEET
jgi:hypothetical protein